MAHIRQSRPDSGLDFQVEILKRIEVVPSSLGSGGLLSLHQRDTGIPRSQETAPPQDPTVGLCLRPYGGPREGSCS